MYLDTWYFIDYTIWQIEMSDIPGFWSRTCPITKPPYRLPPL